MGKPLLKTIAACALACASSVVQAADWQSAHLPQTQETVLVSQENGQRYRIQVARIGAEPPQGYPVVYLLDGDMLFPPALVMANSLMANPTGNRQMPVLLVGIGYRSDRWLDLERRAKDYTPLPESATAEEQDQFGGAEAFGRFIDNELKPLIAGYAKIDSARQAVVGHSFGGLFGVYSLVNHPDRFQYYVLSSPSLWWQDGMMIKQFERFQGAYPAFVRLTVGSLEQGRSDKHRERAMVARAETLAQIFTDKHIHHDFHIYPNENHGSVQFRALQDGLGYLYQQWK